MMRRKIDLLIERNDRLIDQMDRLDREAEGIRDRVDVLLSKVERGVATKRDLKALSEQIKLADKNAAAWIDLKHTRK